MNNLHSTPGVCVSSSTYVPPTTENRETISVTLDTWRGALYSFFLNYTLIFLFSRLYNRCIPSFTLDGWCVAMA